MTNQLKRPVFPTHTATPFGPNSNLGKEAICNLAARLMIVPTDGLVAEHWYSPSSGLSFRVCWTLVKCSEPLASTDLINKR